MGKRNLKYDFIKSIAILGVIIGHSLTLVLSRRVEMQQLADYIAVICRVVVPAFLFISGILHKRGLTFNQIITRIKRILSPYIVFAVIMTAIYLIIGDKTFLSRYIFRIIFCEIHPVYYYVFVMIECLLITFICEKIWGYDKVLIPMYLVFLIGTIISCTFSKELLAISGLSSNMIDFVSYRNPFLWCHYYMLGMLFKKYDLEEFITNHKALVRIFYLCVVIVYAGLRYVNVGDLDNFNSVITTVICILGIMVLLTIEVSSLKWIYLSSKSYTIYLAHVPFYYFLGFLWDTYPNLSIYTMIIINMVVLAVGAMTVCILGKLILKDKSYYFIGS